MWLSLQFTHHCHNYTHLVSIYALLLRFVIFCDLCVLGAKKNCESWVPSQKNRISSHDLHAEKGRDKVQHNTEHNGDHLHEEEGEDQVKLNP